MARGSKWPKTVARCNTQARPPFCPTSAEDQVEEYEIEIVKIFPDSQQDGRDYSITVTDQRLLETTGGIVQGMSGSPILQDGRFIGAVTHVLINDPSCGVRHQCPAYAVCG